MITEGFLPWSPFCMLDGFDDDCGAVVFSLLAFCACWAADVLLAILA
jgi:hypothetical protein